MDPETWDRPEEFRPERFLSEDQTSIEKPENFMPFGIGQRMCLGDQLAEKEFFMFFSSLLHCFEIQNPKSQDLPSLKGVSAITVAPSEFEAIFVPRCDVLSLTNQLNFSDSTHLWNTSNRIQG